MEIQKDRFGRATFTVVGTGLTGIEWIARLEASGHKVTDWAEDILSQPDYDQNHRLEAGKIETFALVLGLEIPKDSDRTTSTLQAIGVRDYGPQAVSDLRGELALLIREKFSIADLNEIDVGYIAVLHKPILDSDGYPGVLFAYRLDDDSWVDANYGFPSHQWHAYGAFPVLAS